jgi:superfamily II DNA or RNA helicase
MSWKPTTPGFAVRLIEDPGRVGHTTGKTRQHGPRLMVQVEFGPGERTYKQYELLEPFEPGAEGLYELFGSGRFGGPADLRRLLVYEKLKGDLTDVYYSMESSNTDFYAHQFKPVLKFVGSPLGRMLIADEVGLGKTIEATYIWKELQARESARRLLIICPSMLVEKWKDDLQRLFNINVEEVRSADLVDKLQHTLRDSSDRGFVFVASLEGMRPPKGSIEDMPDNPRGRLAKLLDENPVTIETALFDLVIVDEAHYMRNPATSSHRLGQLLVDASRHLLLLTATPVQIGSENLFNLLKLIDPDEIYDQATFDRMLEANRHLIGAQQQIWKSPPDIEAAHDAIDRTLENDYFANDEVLKRIRSELSGTKNLSPSFRVDVGRILEARSLIGPYITRSRKREVIEHRVERSPQVLHVRFSEIELTIYETVTRHLRQQAGNKSGAALFALIGRQRQMASSLVAALQYWRTNSTFDEVLWEDIGAAAAASDAVDQTGVEASLDAVMVRQIGGDSKSKSLTEIDLGELERLDGKYDALLNDLIRPKLDANPTEKFVVFAFYRGTLSYLERRLRADGINVALIMGRQKGGPLVDRNKVIGEFAKPDGPSVLLSSEVGSEGIDLQFCRFVVNYDLPWNPMRVEQRIGRIDRLGQQADRISIVNLAVENTVEDRILSRLYDRIQLFKQSIGDLEEILGDVSEKLLAELFNPELSDEERDQRALDAEIAIENKRAQQNELEKQAINLVGFSDYLMDTIASAREQGKWISGEELVALVHDFFQTNYPGTTIEPSPDYQNGFLIHLSRDARLGLAAYLEKNLGLRQTKLSRLDRPILCIFDPRKGGLMSRDAELVDPIHPLTKWIEAKFGQDERKLHPAVAVRIPSSEIKVRPGIYGFFAQRWRLNGLRRESSLKFCAALCDGEGTLDLLDSELLVTTAARSGIALEKFEIAEDKLAATKVAIEICENRLHDAFEHRLDDFEAENSARIDQQKTSAKRFAKRRIEDLKQRIRRMEERGVTRTIQAFRGQIRRQEDTLESRLRRIGNASVVDPELTDIAAGIIQVFE